jgi:type I restriction enzyme S subunit
LELAIRLAPLPEQRRIVARIEELAGKIATARYPEQMVAEEGEQLYPALRDNLFRTLVCERKPIAALFTLVNGRAFGPEEWEPTGRKIIRIQNLKYPGTPFNCFSGLVDDRHLVTKGDVLFAWSGQIVSLGAHIWDAEEAILNQHIFKVVPKAFSIPRFVQEGMNFLVDEMASQVRGLEMFHIRKQELEKIEFPDLPVEDQSVVVEQLDKLQTRSNHMLATQAERKRALDALLPSILDKAFRGVL